MENNKIKKVIPLHEGSNCGMTQAGLSAKAAAHSLSGAYGFVDKAGIPSRNIMFH